MSCQLLFGARQERHSPLKWTNSLQSYQRVFQSVVTLHSGINLEYTYRLLTQISLLFSACHMLRMPTLCTSLLPFFSFTQRKMYRIFAEICSQSVNVFLMNPLLSKKFFETCFYCRHFGHYAFFARQAPSTGIGHDFKTCHQRPKSFMFEVKIPAVAC